MEDLTQKKCVACEGGVPPLSKEESDAYLSQTLGWMLSEDRKRISRKYSFKDFKETIAFVNKVAELAEGEGHHPDLHVFYNKLEIELTTHAIGGLSENDFILAAKINRL